MKASLGLFERRFNPIFTTQFSNMSQEREEVHRADCEDCKGVWFGEKCFAKCSEGVRIIEEASAWSDVACEFMKPGSDPNAVRRFHCYKTAAQALEYHKERVPLPQCFHRAVQEAFGESKVGFKMKSTRTPTEGDKVEKKRRRTID